MIHDEHSLDVRLEDFAALGLTHEAVERFSDDVRPTLNQRCELIRLWMEEIGATAEEIAEALLEERLNDGLGDDGYPA